MAGTTSWGDGSSWRERRGFTLVELLVVIAIIGILVALLLPAIQAAREAARRSQCVNHLKQIGLAIHNFADARNGLPPSTVGYDRTSTGRHEPRASFWILILPYLEQEANYDLVHSTTDGFAEPVTNPIFWNTLSREERNSFSISTYFCPSRRSRGDVMGDGEATVQGGIHGPRGDYAMVQGRERRHWALWLNNYEPYEGEVSLQRGPLRSARWTGTGPQSWRPRDTFAWWRDGMSNQIVVGEKQIHQDHINVCPASPGSSVDDRARQSDCSIIATGDWGTIPTARSFNAGIARSASEVPSFAETGVHWGSNHPGVCNFLIGDGSVRSIAVTIPTGDGPNFLFSRLGNVSDGNPVSLD